MEFIWDHWASGPSTIWVVTKIWIWKLHETLSQLWLPDFYLSLLPVASMVSLLWKRSGGTAFQQSLEDLPHRDRAQGCPSYCVSGDAQLPLGYPQGGVGKATGVLLLQPHPDRGIWTSSELILPGICMLALGSWECLFLPSALLGTAPWCCCWCSHIDQWSEQPASLQTKETGIWVKETIKNTH